MRMLGCRRITGALASTAERASSVRTDSSRSKYIVAASAVRSASVTGAVVAGPAAAAAAAAAAEAARAASALASESSLACSRKRLSVLMRRGAGLSGVLRRHPPIVIAKTTATSAIRVRIGIGMVWGEFARDFLLLTIQHR